MPNANPRHSPGVRVPPPLIYAAAFGIGWGLNQLWPLAILPAAFTDTSAWVAKPLAAAGAILALVSLSRFAKYRTAVAPSMGASTLITGSLYRLSRNPIYLSFTLIYLGATLRTNIAWALLGLPPVLWIMNRHVIAREEQHLTAVFGEDYLAYCRSVRRWL